MAGIVDIAGVEARSPTSAGSPGGSTGQLQYNDNGAFGGAGWSYNSGTGALTAGGNLDLDGYDLTNVNILLAGDDFGFIQTHTHANDTWNFQAYDTDGAAYQTFMVLTAGDPPSLSFPQPAVQTGIAFGSLPATPVAGMIAHVTDSDTATWGATISGGGANVVLAWYNGTNWTVIGA